MWRPCAVCQRQSLAKVRAQCGERSPVKDCQRRKAAPPRGGILARIAGCLGCCYGCVME